MRISPVVDYANLIEQVVRLTGLSDREHAARAVLATVSALGSCLTAADRERWAVHLPLELHSGLSADTYAGPPTAVQFYARVPAVEGVPQPYAIEHAQVVMRLLGDMLPEAERSLLARHLPDGIAELLQPALHGAPPAHPRVVTVSASGSTLATGAAGSRHPLSDAAPESAQQGSPADWNADRMDHSLGSGRDDASADTLAQGKPGSKRGLSG